MVHHTLPEEDTLHHRAHPQAQQVNLALVVYPYASNLDEFDPLVHEPGVTVVPVRGCERLDGYHAILLPGSKNTVASLRYLRQSGLAAEISRAAQRGVPVLGICGGLQLLGREIMTHTASRAVIAQGWAARSDDHPGARQKSHASARCRGKGPSWWLRNSPRADAGWRGSTGLFTDGLGWCQDNVYGVYVHGLFDNAPIANSF